MNEPEQHSRGHRPGRFREIFLLGCLTGSVVVGLSTRSLPTAWAEVRATPSREAFKSGGERSEVALREILDVLKQMDRRLKRIEETMTRKR